MIVESTRLPNGDIVSDKPTGRLRWVHRLDARGHAHPSLQQEFDRTRFVGEEEIDEGSFWRDVPTDNQGPIA